MRYEALTVATTATTKQALIEQVQQLLRAEHAVAERQALETAASANDPEAKPENDKDTRKVELSYLAAGQAERTRGLAAALAVLGSMGVRTIAPRAPIESGALVSLKIDDKPQRVLVLPAGGGIKLAYPGGVVSVVTPQSPLGSGLLGKTLGDEFELPLAGKQKTIEVVAVE